MPTVDSTQAPDAVLYDKNYSSNPSECYTGYALPDNGYIMDFMFNNGVQSFGRIDIREDFQQVVLHFLLYLLHAKTTLTLS